MAATRDTILQPKGYYNDPTISAASALVVPAGAKYALIKVEGQSVRWRDDGTDPTTTLGMLIDVGDEFWYTGQLTKIKFIETAATASLHVSFYS